MLAKTLDTKIVALYHRIGILVFCRGLGGPDDVWNERLGVDTTEVREGNIHASSINIQNIVTPNGLSQTWRSELYINIRINI